MIECDMLDEDFACLAVRVRSQLDLLTESLIDSSLCSARIQGETVRRWRTLKLNLHTDR